jgi:hypothetical protein
LPRTKESCAAKTEACTFAEITHPIRHPIRAATVEGVGNKHAFLCELRGFARNLFFLGF